MKRSSILARLFASSVVLVSLLCGNAWAESGKATIESDKFSGKKTATGEKYNKNAMTVASPTLPLGSKVKVTNKKTGKSAIVRVNDKQPAGGGKVVDLSKAAAKQLGVKGTAPVEAQVVSKGQK